MRTNTMYEQGFTLIELMITLAVLAIIISLAAPSFVTMIQNNRATGATNDLIVSFQLARAEATKRNGTVLIKKKDNAGTRSCSDAGDWACGHQIGVDLDSDGNLIGAELLRDVKEPHSSIEIDSIDSESDPVSKISYVANGGVSFDDQDVTFAEFTLDSTQCETGVTRKVRNVRLYLSGRRALTHTTETCS